VLSLALLGPACSGPQRDPGREGVRGGTLRVLTETHSMGLDTAGSYGAIARAYARTLYGYDVSEPPKQKTVPAGRARRTSAYKRSAGERRA
jgi:hypothetical protein